MYFVCVSVLLLNIHLGSCWEVTPVIPFVGEEEATHDHEGAAPFVSESIVEPPVDVVTDLVISESVADNVVDQVTDAIAAATTTTTIMAISEEPIKHFLTKVSEMLKRERVTFSRQVSS